MLGVLRVLGVLRENLLQPLQLFLAIGKDIEMIALRLEVGKGLTEQVEVLMKQGLLGGMECQGGIRLLHRTMPELYLLVRGDSLHELVTVHQRNSITCLLISTVYGIMDILEVFGND